MISRAQSPIRYGASYDAGGGLAINTARTIVAAASNTKGLVLVAADWWGQAAAAGAMTLIAHTAAPTAATDGDTLKSAGPITILTGPVYGFQLILEGPRYVPAGKGLYAICSVALAADYLSAIYTLRG